MEWKSEVEFRDLLKDFDFSKNEREEIQRIKPIWIERFNQYDELKKFIPALKKVKTLKAFNLLLVKTDSGYVSVCPCTKFQFTTNVDGANSTKPLL